MLVCPLFICVLVACGGSTASPDGGGNPDAAHGVNQIPPMGETTLRPWLDAHSYSSWHCEAAAHAGRGNSPHGMVRICANDAAYGASAGGDLPVGAAAVKELYDAAGAHIVGYAVAERVTAGAGASHWYFFEQVPAGTTPPMGITISPTGVIADGMGNSGQAMTVCAGCHSGASAAGGIDELFTPHPM